MIISCTKPLHNSFCIHFDVFWCILMHFEHLEINVLFLAPKAPILAILMYQKHFMIILCTKYFYNSFCILTHIHSFWAIEINKNHFFDNFVHKNFAQLILYAFWCICENASKCISVHQNASACIKMHQMFVEWIVQIFCA